MGDTFNTWPECAAQLVGVAAGRIAADTVILGGRVANVHTREILRWDIAIAAGRFAYVGPDASHCIGPNTKVLCTDEFVIPGLSFSCTWKVACPLFLQLPLVSLPLRY